MEHLLILTQDDIIEYATKLLALRGVKPAVPIVFEPVKGQKGAFRATITCVSTDFPENCPQCGHAAGQALVVPRAPNVTAIPVQPATPALALDEKLGESFDPPGVGESGARATSVSGGEGDAEGMSALVHQSKRLEAQLNREREERRRREREGK